MRRTNKKGFTIVELVIVIAVIAILAAVLIPTFASLVKKANVSVDEQLVSHMNKILLSEEVTDGKPSAGNEAKDILSANGIEQFAPVTDGYTFYWVGAENRVLLYEEDSDRVVYPQDMAKQYSTYNEAWFDLSKDLPVLQITETEAGVYSALTAKLSEVTAGSEVYIRLPENAELTGDLSALSSQASGKNVTIDLNGGKMINTDGNAQSRFDKITAGTVQIINGSIEIEVVYDANDTDKQGYSAIKVSDSGTLVLRDVNLHTNDYSIFPDTTGSVVIENCTIKSDISAAFSTNAQSTKFTRTVINNSTLEGPTAMVVNCPSSIEINNSTFIGQTHAIVCRAGTMSIRNSTLQTTAVEVDVGNISYKSFTAGNDTSSGKHSWLSGEGVPAAALTIGHYGNKAYENDADVMLSNVTIKTADENAIPQVLMASGRYDDSVISKVSKLTYDSSTTITTLKLYGDDWNDTTSKPTNNSTIIVNGEKKN